MDFLMAPPTRIQVTAAAGAYPVIVGARALDSLPDLLDGFVEPVVTRGDVADDSIGFAIKRVDLQRRRYRGLVVGILPLNEIECGRQRKRVETVGIDRLRFGDRLARKILLVLVDRQLR